MPRDSLSRRSFLTRSGAALGTAVLATSAWRAASAAENDNGLHVATNLYPWLTFYGRENREFFADLDTSLGEVAAAGLNGFEPIINGAEDIDRLAPPLEKHGLEMRSFYVNSVLHEEQAAEESLARILALAKKAKQIGTRIIVTNPSPKSWDRGSGTADKTDAELIVQGNALDQLGAELRKVGVTLAYHNHDMELRNAAREFHHMMVATQPQNVTLCLDAHWIYRGSGDSQVALFDVIQLYGDRVSELHLRQSQDGVWTEAFGPGDIDYPRLVQQLAKKGVSNPHLVLEQAVEGRSPDTLTAEEAHRQGCRYTRELFGG